VSGGVSLRQGIWVPKLSYARSLSWVEGMLVILLLRGLVYLELQAPELTAIDGDSFALATSPISSLLR
jgi:hypothetical protein